MKKVKRCEVVKVREEQKSEKELPRRQSFKMLSDKFELMTKKSPNKNNKDRRWRRDMKDFSYEVRQMTQKSVPQNGVK